ncbi:5'-3' exonuclease H3TH domain-containing protein [Streptomyces sp. NPDC058471]|uniref:5'-3' exonuclease n=1 Tax=Streptomyces sp. NPDC058471 TaxID=3346516 RepID=UPI003646A5AE
MTTPLLLVDGHNLLYRSWFGFAARIWNRDHTIDRTGIFGFAALLRKAQLQHAPSHEIVVVIDAEDGSQSRAAEDSDYKANRTAPEPGLIESLADIKHGLDACGVRWIEQDGCEGDDVLATLTTTARHQERATDIMSADKDFIQLLDDPQVRLLNTGLAEAKRYTTSAHVPARYGITANQWPDYRALTGDPSDNIAGIRGVGPKTAVRLLADGASLDQVPATALKPSWCDQWEQALRWREMIRLDRKVDLPDNLLTGAPTPELPRAAQLLERLDLW